MWWRLFQRSFAFLDPGPLVDGDLELVPPQQRYLDDMLRACGHPATLSEAPGLARVTRHGLLHALAAAPHGHHPGDGGRSSVPSYHFWMRLTGPNAPLPIAGTVSLRIGQTPDVQRYLGHIGYNVYPAARGHRLAERAARLLLPLAARHDLGTLWITANPENLASRRTCQRLGATLVDQVPVPAGHELHARGDRAKCRYKLEL